MTNDECQISNLAQEPMIYFPHDSDAFQDVKCQRLLHRRGWDGYGRWWRICEYMAATTGHRIAFETDEDALILAGVLGFTQMGAYRESIVIEDCRSFVNELLDIGLLRLDGDGFLSNSRMQNNAIYFGKKRHSGRKGGRPRKGSVKSMTTGKEE